MLTIETVEHTESVFTQEIMEECGERLVARQFGLKAHVIAVANSILSPRSTKLERSKAGVRY